jgi:hypothetical protein
MAVRLQMKLGYVAEQNRLADSPDTIRPHEPSVGAILRSKGSLYLLVTAQAEGHRLREATSLVADAIESEYYYDESAGIRVCLEKAIRNANKRLAHVGDRYGLGHHGDGSGPVGVAAAVIRGNELYVATVGPAEAYLIRQARLSTLPDPHRDRGLPAEGLEPEVWRGEISVGDSLVLVSPNFLAKLGPDELKDALVTLHPQSAMEHLHHRFVAADGSGSDGAIAVEATEVAATVKQRTLVPVRPPEPLAGVPERSPIPLAGTVGDGVAAVSASAQRARSAAGGAAGRMVRNLQDMLPTRSTPRRRVRTVTSRVETQRRAAMAILALVAVGAVLATGVWVAGGSGRSPRGSLTAAQNALESIRTDLAKVAGPGIDLIRDDRKQALELLTDAYRQIDVAQQGGAPAATLGPLRAKVMSGLDQLFDVVPVGTTIVFNFQTAKPPVDLSAMVRGPDGMPYVLDRGGKSVYRVDLKTKKATVVLRAGQRVQGIAVADPRFLAVGGRRDLLILDSRNTLWRWRPADARGRGTLKRILVNGSASWGADVRGIGTFQRGTPDQGLYNLYVVDPSRQQLLVYTPALDGGGYPSSPTGRLSTAQPVDDVDALLIDGDIYFAQGGAVRQAVPAANWQASEIGDTLIHPAMEVTRLSSYDGRGTGLLYVFDAANARVIAYDKGKSQSSNNFVVQYRLANGDLSWRNLRGFYVVPGAAGSVPSIVWIDGQRVGISVLQAVQEAVPGASPPPGSTPSSSARPATAKPSPKPTR